MSASCTWRDKVTALNSKGLRQPASFGRPARRDKVTALNSKGLRRKIVGVIGALRGQSNCPEFKGIKTSAQSFGAFCYWDKVTALNSKGLRRTWRAVTGAVMDKVTALNSKGLRPSRQAFIVISGGQSNCPEFKGIKTESTIP